MKVNSPYRLTTSLLLCWLASSWWPSTAARGSAGAQQPGADDLEVVAVRPDFYMIAGAGGNIAVQIGPDRRRFSWTPGPTPIADRVLPAIKRLTNNRIRYIINTSADADHAGGNEKLSKAGQTILGNHGSAGVSEDGLHQRRRGQRPRARERPGEDERADRASSFRSAVWPTKSLHRQRLPDVSQRRRDSGAAHARCALRRRQRRVLPARRRRSSPATSSTRRAFR